ncbi:hypothetical protein BRADI_2g18120v3 [Brachypodium distachyon]|uniref:Uncharacterized protein n=1 Tax=Brachypodium distachyon TaxID=15368 RepID=A0A0Q3MLI1_BRADI|nr:hypothetical protein BRADI_2g18120v3 [Brachypodium distachyon]
MLAPKLKHIVAAILLMALLITAASGETSTAVSNERDTSSEVIKNDRVRLRHTMLEKRNSTNVLTEVLDYDYGGANSKHDPRGRRPGNGH